MIMPTFLNCVRFLDIVFAIQLTLLSSTKAETYKAIDEGLRFEEHCNIYSMPFQNCTPSVFCTCGHHHFEACSTLDIICLQYQNRVCLKTGQCITYDNETATMGHCPYYAKHLVSTEYCSAPLKVYQKLPPNLTELTSYFCEDFNREGPLCSQCKPGYGPAVYAFGWMCAKCKNNGLGWVLYILLVFFPITFFYIFIVIFNIRATHPILMSLILVSQVFCSTEQSYLVLTSVYQQYSHTQWLHQLVKVLCGMWNLDFFRNLIPPFCLSSHLTNVDALYLESLYIVYPLLLILLTYICIELHANNFKLMVYSWKPFHRYFSRFRRAWDPKASIINAFSSFFLLISSRTIVTAIRSLHTVRIYELTAHHSLVKQTALYIDTIASRRVPLIYGITLLVLFLFPTLLLCTYPIKYIRLILEHFLSLNTQSALKAFLDTFHGHCKDGTDGTRDFRAVSGLHMFVLLAVTSFQIFWSTTLDSMPAIPLVCFATSIFIALARPYKRTPDNAVSSILFGLIAFYLTVISHTFAQHKHVVGVIFILLTCVLAPHLILIGYVFYKHIIIFNNVHCLIKAICSNGILRHIIIFNHDYLEISDLEHENSSIFE